MTVGSGREPHLRRIFDRRLDVGQPRVAPVGPILGARRLVQPLSPAGSIQQVGQQRFVEGNPHALRVGRVAGGAARRRAEQGAEPLQNRGLAGVAEGAGRRP